MRYFDFGFLREAERIKKDKTLDDFPFTRWLMVHTYEMAEAICWAQVALILWKLQEKMAVAK